MNSPAADPEAASVAEPNRALVAASTSPRWRIAPVGTQHHDRTVCGSLIAPLSRRAGQAMAGTSLPAMANLFAAGGAVSPARAAAQAQDARQRVDPVTAVALPAANRRGCPQARSGAALPTLSNDVAPSFAST